MASAGAFFKRFAAMTWEWTRVVYGITALIGAALSPVIIGIKLQKDMEDARVGITGILVSMTNLNGKAMEFNDAWRISGTLVKEVQADSIKYGIQMGQIVNTFRAILAPGIGAGMSIAEIQKLASVGSVAVSAIGLPAQQMVQEIRDLVTGGIQASQNTLATALGITGADIREIQRNGGDLFKFLMDRLEGFGRVAEETRKATLSGSWEIFLGKLGLALAANSGPFDMLKEAIHGATKALEDPATKDAIAGYTKVLMGLGEALGYSLKGWGLLLSELDRKLPEMKVPGSWGMLIKLVELLPKTTFIDTTNERPWKSQGVQNHFAPNAQGQSDVITQNDLSVLADVNKDITTLHAKYETEAERHGKAVLDIETKYDRGISEQRLLAFKAYSADDMKMFQEHQNTAAQLQKQMQSDLSVLNAKKTDPNAAAVLQLQNENMKKQFELAGASTAQFELYKIATNGATIADIDLAQAAADGVVATEKEIAARKEAISITKEMAAEDKYFTEALNKHDQKIADDAARTAKEFQKNVQRDLGDVLYLGLQGKFKDIGDMFKQMLLRMTADAMSAKLSQAMFGGGAGLMGLGASGAASAGAQTAAWTPAANAAAGGGMMAGAATVLPYVAAAYGIMKYGFGMGNEIENVGPKRLVGDFNRTGFSGNYQQDWKQDGSWFLGGSSGSNKSYLTKEETKAWKETTDGLQKTFFSLGTTVGIADIKTKAWSVHVNQAGDVTATLADAMGSQLIPSLVHLQQTGENLAQTAQRVNDAFVSTTSLISGLGLGEASAFGSIGIASADARLALVSAAGGLQNFTALASSFSSAILTPAQQLQVSLDAVGMTFAQLGVSGVETNQQFADLVAAQLKLGNYDTVTQLLSVAGAFGAITKSAADLAGQLKTDSFKTMVDYKMAVARSGTTGGQTAIDAAVSGAAAQLPSLATANASQAIKDAKRNAYDAEVAAAVEWGGSGLYSTPWGPLGTDPTTTIARAEGATAYWIPRGTLDKQPEMRARMDAFNKARDYYDSLPSFAIGTPFVSHDMTANIHRGERIVSAADNTSLVTEVKALRAEVAGLRASNESSAASNKRTYDLLRNVTRDGQSLLTTAA